MSARFSWQFVGSQLYSWLERSVWELSILSKNTNTVTLHVVSFIAVVWARHEMRSLPQRGGGGGEGEEHVAWWAQTTAVKETTVILARTQTRPCNPESATSTTRPLWNVVHQKRRIHLDVRNLPPQLLLFHYFLFLLRFLQYCSKMKKIKLQSFFESEKQ